MFITDRIVIPSVDICSSSLNFKKMAKGWRIVGAVSISTSFCAQTEPCPGPVLFLAVKGFRFSAPYCSSRGIQNSTDTDEVAQCSALIREKGSSRLQLINLKIISTCIKINLILQNLQWTGVYLDNANIKTIQHYIKITRFDQITEEKSQHPEPTFAIFDKKKTYNIQSAFESRLASESHVRVKYKFPDPNQSHILTNFF